MIWQPKLFLYEGNNFNHQSHLEIIKIKIISSFFMKSSFNYHYSLSIVYSNQHKFIILLHKIMIKMYIDDDTQKERIIIPSLGGAEDVSVGRSSCFQILEPKDSIFIEKRIESCCSGSKGIDPWWLTWCFSPKLPEAPLRKPLQNLNAFLVISSFNYSKIPWTLSNFLECFLPTKYPKIQDFKLKSSFIFHSLTNTLLYTIFLPKLSFFQIFLSFSFFSFL